MVTRPRQALAQGRRWRRRRRTGRELRLYVSMRQRIRQHASAHTSACVSAYVSIRSLVPAAPKEKSDAAALDAASGIVLLFQ